MVKTGTPLTRLALVLYRGVKGDGMIDATNCSLFSIEHFEKYCEELLAAMEQREQLFRNMAEVVFDAALAYPENDPKLITSRDPASGKLTIKNPDGEALDRAINNCLTHRSIGYFIELVQENHESAKQVARAIKRHTENHAMKSEVFQWLESQSKFKSNEAAAMAITKQQPIAHVTARDWYKEWKKLRSASTP